jgi:hypothetical protein
MHANSFLVCLWLWSLNCCGCRGVAACVMRLHGGAWCAWVLWWRRRWLRGSTSPPPQGEDPELAVAELNLTYYAVHGTNSARTVRASMKAKSSVPLASLGSDGDGGSSGSGGGGGGGGDGDVISSRVRGGQGGSTKSAGRHRREWRKSMTNKTSAEQQRLRQHQETRFDGVGTSLVAREMVPSLTQLDGETSVGACKMVPSLSDSKTPLDLTLDRPLTSGSTSAAGNMHSHTVTPAQTTDGNAAPLFIASTASGMRTPSGRILVLEGTIPNSAESGTDGPSITRP